jgi:hypothetical protein
MAGVPSAPCAQCPDYLNSAIAELPTYVDIKVELLLDLMKTNSLIGYEAEKAMRERIRNVVTSIVDDLY